MFAGPGYGRIEVGHDLLVGHLADNVLVELLDGRVLRCIALANVEVRRNRQITELRESTADVGDVLVHAEDFVHDHDHRQMRLAFRLRAVGGHERVARVNAHLAGF